MRILLANPNATIAITDACLALARGVASPGTAVVGWTNASGPAVVDSFYADYAAGGPLARGLSAAAPGTDAVVLAGFGNYGAAAVKEALAIPVVSMAEAAMGVATLLTHRFAIVTTSRRMIAYTEDLVATAGFAPRCTAVRAVELPPIGEAPPSEEAIVGALADEAERVAADTGAEAVVLGGARLAVFAAALRRRTRVPVIEPVACGVLLAESLVRMGLAQSKLGKFAPPPRPLAEYD